MACFTLLTGCGSEKNNAAKDDNGKITIEDVKGNVVEVPKDIKKIAVVPLPWASVVTALDGNSERIVAIHPGAMSAYKSHFLATKDSHFGTLNTELIGQDFSVNAPFISLREWYHQVLPLIIANGLGDCQRPEIHLFSDREQWLELASGCDIIIGDSTFNISGALSDKIWINITDPSLYAGEKEMNDKYLFFGKKGAAWLETKYIGKNLYK
jgi:hypothetical protein